MAQTLRHSVGVSGKIMTPIISIIIPVFRVERYIRRCLNSVQKQNFEAMEVILVDDCGGDASISIARKLLGEDSRFRIIRNERNLGQGPARDRGVQAARGEYLLFLDADDYLADNTLERLFTAANQDQPDVIAFQARHLHRFSRRTYPEFPRRVSGSGREFLPAFLMTGTPEKNFPNIENYEWNKLIRRTLIADNHIHHLPERLLGEDFYFTTQLLVFARKVLWLPETLYFYDRRNTGSLTAQTDLDFFATCFFPIAESRTFLQQHEAWSPEVEKRFFMHIYRHFYFETLLRLSFVSDHFNRRLLQTVSSGLKQYDLWREQPELWRGFEPVYIALRSKHELPPTGKCSMLKLKLLKLKIYHLPRWLVRLKKKLFRQKK